jgi:hypothetical protein
MKESECVRILAPISIWINAENELKCSEQCFFYDDCYCTLYQEQLIKNSNPAVANLPYRCDNCLASESLLYNMKNVINFEDDETINNSEKERE